MTKVTIELEFEGKGHDEATLREAVYAYLEELINDDSLFFETKEERE
jgi:hypothetical protein